MTEEEISAMAARVKLYRGNITKGYVSEPSLCHGCRFLHRLGRSCDAFPDEWPEAIKWDYLDHTGPYPGDRGIRFEPRDSSEETGAKTDSTQMYLPDGSKNPSAWRRAQIEDRYFSARDSKGVRERLQDLVFGSAGPGSDDSVRAGHPAPQCHHCKNWVPNTRRCTAYPLMIPQAIWENYVDHRRFFPGDQYRTFEATSPEASERVDRLLEESLELHLREGPPPVEGGLKGLVDRISQGRRATENPCPKLDWGDEY